VASCDSSGDLFACVCNRPAHLLSDLPRQLIFALGQDVKSLFYDLLALFKCGLAVFKECLLRRLGQFGELGVGGALSFDNGLVRDRRDGGDRFDGHDGGR